MELTGLRAEVYAMTDKIISMISLIERGFMDNKHEPLGLALDVEHEINALEKALAARILEVSKLVKDAPGRAELVRLLELVETFERMGDEAAGLIERIEIKIADALLFDELSVQQFNETYRAMRASIDLMRDFLLRGDAETAEKAVANGFRVKELVERFRKEHTERLIQGLCAPTGANTYFDMLDFTGNLARHASSVVRLFR